MFTCRLCTNTIEVKPRVYKKRNGLCVKCFNSIPRPFNCESCKIEYISTHNEFNKYNKALCEKCLI
jgi:hypothetical protein